MPQALSEPELKQQLAAALRADFELRAEVAGQHLLDGYAVKIDYLLFPRPHLVQKGFDAEWFGCEVKSPAQKEPDKVGVRFAWQCVTYAQAVFGECGRPMFVLMYPGLEQFFQGPEYDSPNNSWHWLNVLLQKGNVGHLVLGSKYGWGIRFGASVYYWQGRGRGKVANLGTKRHVGSWR